jgi:site-specific DNA-methyltransferase (adenine-specific)
MNHRAIAIGAPTFAVLALGLVWTLSSPTGPLRLGWLWQSAATAWPRLRFWPPSGRHGKDALVRGEILTMSKPGATKAAKSPIRKHLHYGDNLDVMRAMPDNFADLTYLDPPFNSNLDYAVLFTEDGIAPDEAQMTAFKDTWTWGLEAQSVYEDLQEVPNPRLVNLINALHLGLERTPMLAYLVNMAIRLVEIRRVMKDDGSIYIHCDPTASHYLKMLMDSIFGPQAFKSEIIWRRTGSHNKARRWAPIHDTILFYTKSETYTWNNPRRPYMMGHVKTYFVADGSGGYKTNYYGNVLTGSGTRNGESGQPWMGFDPTSKGRHWAVPGAIWEEVGADPSGLTQHQKLDLLYSKGFITITPGQMWPLYERTIQPGEGPATSDLWTFQPYTEGTVFGAKDGIDADVRWMSPQDGERLGYPTQKPVGLLKRIIMASSNRGDVVFDPFCGCGTTIAAAEELTRDWVGIDISPFAIGLIRKQRLAPLKYLKEGVDYDVTGLPTTLAGAKMMWGQDPKAFEIWCLTELDGIPNEKRGGDKGIDGRIGFKADGKKTQFAVVSVKGGKLKADDVRSLAHVAQREKASSLGFGVLVSMEEPTQGMKTDAASAGTATFNDKKYPLIQWLTVGDMLAGKRPNLPLIDRTVGYGNKTSKAISGQQDDML